MVDALPQTQLCRLCFGQPEQPGQVGQVGQVSFWGVITTLINEYRCFGSKLANLAKLCRGRGGAAAPRGEIEKGVSGAWGAMLGLGRGSLRCRDGVRRGWGIYLSNMCAAEAGSAAWCIYSAYMVGLRRERMSTCFATEFTARAMPAAQHQRPDLPQKILFTAKPRRREVYKWNLIK